jgi:hypothetical protein
MLHNPRNFNNSSAHNNKLPVARLSKKVINQVKSISPLIRNELLSEFERWGSCYVTCPQFFSDETLLKILPYAAYEYIILAWNVEPSRLNKDAAISALNGKIFKDIHKITAHALRRIACINALKTPE